MAPFTFLADSKNSSVTVIALVNSLADGLTNLELSKKGYILMALTSVFSA